VVGPAGGPTTINSTAITKLLR